MMPGYVIANYTIHNREEYDKYPPAVGPTISQYGGRLLVVDREVKALEGEPGQVIVVLEFESVEAAQRWYDSPEYSAIKHLRTSTSDGWLVITKEFVMTGG